MTIGINTIASGGTRADTLAMFGAAMVAVIDRLENKGIRVELFGTASYDKGFGCKRNQRVSWLVKGAGDPLDLSAVAFGIGHPAMMRRLTFAVVERSDKENQCSSYGQCGKNTLNSYVDIAPDALLIEGVGTTAWRAGERYKTMSEMIRFAEEQLNEASIKLTGEPIAALGEL